MRRSGVGEAGAVDDALRWVIIDVNAIQLREEAVTVADPPAKLAGGARIEQGALHAILAQRVGARPFWRLPVRPSLDPRLQRSLPAQGSEHLGASDGIVARSYEVTYTQIVRLILLLPREPQRVHLGALLDQPPEKVVAENGAENPPEHAIAAALSILLADMRVVGGDVSRLMSNREREFRLVVHDGHQLPRHVNVAPGH